ncbi:hypothetical protein JCM19236_2411 [Vibrio sp. JCM 19236]|nr:hypothetical protein JCM19236_2411 [Vibrio sp. JCM 19236]
MKVCHEATGIKIADSSISYQLSAISYQLSAISYKVLAPHRGAIFYLWYGLESS